MNLMKKMIKPAVLAVAISMTLIGSQASAASRSTGDTLLIHGYQPMIPIVGAKGKLVPGEKITISDTFYQFFDRDNGTADTEVDISKSTIQWYIRDFADKDQPLPSSTEAWGTGLEFTIPYQDAQGNDIDYVNTKKVLGFRIIPKTENGLPMIGEAIEVTNSIMFGGSVIPEDLPPGTVPETPDDKYNPGTPTEPDGKNPDITGPGGNEPPEGPVDPTDPPDESGIIYPNGEDFLVRIAYAKLDATGQPIITNGVPELDDSRIIYDDLADATQTVTIPAIDAYGKPLLEEDGVSVLPDITVSKKTPNIPTVNAQYAVAIYQGKRDNAGVFIRDANGNIEVKSDVNGPINMVSAFKNSITWSLAASSVGGSPTIPTPPAADAFDAFDKQFLFNTQLNNEVAKAVSSIASEQGLIIKVNFNDNLGAAENKEATPTP